MTLADFPKLGVLCLAFCFAGQSTSALDAGCTESARLLSYACVFDLEDELLTATAQCQDNSSVDPQCLDEAAADRVESEEECTEIFAARVALCETLNDATHEPEFGPDFAANFVDPRAIGDTVAANPYLPLIAGNRWVYEGGDEVITVVVTDRIKRIAGIDCVVVNDVVTEDGALIEDTDDWFAQDVNGDVWYCGEIAKNFEYFDDDDPVEAELVDLEGSWKAGRDGARAGVLLPFAPIVGETLRQEVLLTDAEDVIEIQSINASESTPAASCSETCLQTRDYTPLEPGVEEHKYYAPNIGMILEVDPETGERVELVEFTGAGA